VKQASFFSHATFRWARITALVVLAVGLLYAGVTPVGATGGRSPIGLGFGIAAAALLVLMLAYGLRKRTYGHWRTPLKGFLSFHVWLGLLPLVLAMLHAGFSFGANVQTLGFVLLLAAILSGYWGAWNFLRHAPQIGAHHGQGDMATLAEEFLLASQEMAVLRECSSELLQQLIDELDPGPAPTLRACLLGPRLNTFDSETAATRVQQLVSAERAAAYRVVHCANHKIVLWDKLRRETRTLTNLRLWLYVHVPLAYAAGAAVLVHIVTVLRFW
jgi:hypothetical protein